MILQHGFEEFSAGEDGDVASDVGEQIGRRIGHLDDDAGVGVELTNARDGMERL